MHQQHNVVSSQARIDALRAKHRSLSKQIEENQRSLSVSDFRIRELKQEKLKVKEEIEGIRQASY